MTLIDTHQFHLWVNSAGTIVFICVLVVCVWFALKMD